eukprot:5028606-Pyramimonas_sp.AAC.1
MYTVGDAASNALPPGWRHSTRAFRRAAYSRDGMPGVSSPGASRSGCVRGVGCPVSPEGRLEGSLPEKLKNVRGVRSRCGGLCVADARAAPCVGVRRLRRCRSMTTDM